jgi:hypothetical protein
MAELRAEWNLDAYRRDGVAVIPAVFAPDEVPAWAAECDRLWANRELFDPDNLRTRVLLSPPRDDRLDPVKDVSPIFAELAEDSRLLAIAADALGRTPVLFKDKLIAKPPGARGYLAHQDFTYWQRIGYDPSLVTTLVVCIDGAGPENGAMEYAPGRHDRHLTPPQEILDLDDDVIDPASWVALHTEPGDVVLLHPLAPHRSGHNTSPQWRRQAFFTYAATDGDHDMYGDYYTLFQELRRESLVDDDGARAFWR